MVRRLQRLAVLLLRRFVDGGMFSTLNAPCLQMRVRDHRPYSPLYSDRFGRFVSDKSTDMENCLSAG